MRIEAAAAHQTKSLPRRTIVRIVNRVAEQAEKGATACEVHGGPTGLFPTHHDRYVYAAVAGRLAGLGIGMEAHRYLQSTAIALSDGFMPGFAIFEQPTLRDVILVTSLGGEPLEVTPPSGTHQVQLYP